MSLTKEVYDLYKKGHIREHVMQHAVKEASKARSNKQFIKKADLAGRRAAIFNAYTPSMFKLARDKEPISLMKRLGPVGSLLGGALALTAASDFAKDVRRSMQHKESFRKMIMENPELAENPELTKKHFDIMKKFAPDLAANPTIAAGHVRQAIEMGNVVPADTIKNLAMAQKTHGEASASGGVTHQILGGLAGGIGNLITKADELDII